MVENLKRIAVICLLALWFAGCESTSPLAAGPSPSDAPASGVKHIIFYIPGMCERLELF